MKTILTVMTILLSLLSATAIAGYFPSYRDTHGKRVFVFDPRHHAWAVYDENGKRIRQGRASGGSEYCPDLRRACKTPAGTYRIYSKKGVDCVSSKFPLKTRGGALMPYCMHFHGGYAIHGVPKMTRGNESHGCIRVKTNDAKWLNQKFMHIGTKVVVLPY